MAWVPDSLKQVAEQVKEGKRPLITVRQLLRWFNSYRRRYWVIRYVRNALNELGLVTVPDFEEPPLDGIVNFVAKPAPALAPAPDVPARPNGDGAAPADGGVGGGGQIVADIPARVATTEEKLDPRLRLSRLPSADRPPVSVKPDATVTEAITIMLTRNFSQLPVMQSERDVKGIFTWKSFGQRVAMGRPCEKVRDAMIQHKELNHNDSIFEAVRVIAENDFVLVRDETKKVTGIVTASDISYQFQQLAEPFMLLGEIENQIRALMAPKFDKGDLESVKDPDDTERNVEDVSDLTFGEYVRLLENPEKWQKLGLKVDRAVFVKALDDVRNIRNEVMHFDPDGIEDTDLRKLREFAGFLDQIQQLIGG